MKTNNNLQMDPISIFNNFDLIFGIKTSEVVLSLCGPRPLTLFHTWTQSNIITQDKPDKRIRNTMDLNLKICLHYWNYNISVLDWIVAPFRWLPPPAQMDLLISRLIPVSYTHLTLPTILLV